MLFHLQLFNTYLHQSLPISDTFAVSQGRYFFGLVTLPRSNYLLHHVAYSLTSYPASSTRAESSFKIPSSSRLFDASHQRFKPLSNFATGTSLSLPVVSLCYCSRLEDINGLQRIRRSNLHLPLAVSTG